MAYRNGTYIAFHAGGTTDPTASDIRYYRILKAWHENDSIEFKFVNSHEKASAVRDSSKKETLRRSLRERLNNSRNMVLIIGPTTRFDDDWVPFEIAHAVDVCKIPIIATYPDYSIILNPAALAPFWPKAFADRIATNLVRAIHIPFKQRAIDDAIGQFDFNNMPATALNYYTVEAQRAFGIPC
jgi:hypothetical protein